MTLEVVAAVLTGLAFAGLVFVAIKQDQLLRESFKAMRAAGDSLEVLAEANARLCHRGAIEAAVGETWRKAAIVVMAEHAPDLLARLRLAESEFRSQQEAKFIASRPAARPEAKA